MIGKFVNMMRTSQILMKVSRFSRVATNLSIRNPKITNSRLRIFGYTNLGLITIHCDKLSELNEINTDKLTHEECIKQACMISTNSATTLLTTATSAVIDVCLKYKKSLSRILGLYEEILLTQGENPDVWQVLVESRNEVGKMKAALSELSSYMSSVEKVVNSTTEAAFLAGAEYLCTVLCERLYSAQAEITKCISEIKKLEDDILKLEEEVAKKVNKGD